MKLSDLKIGQSAVFHSFTDDEISLKFLEMGCVPGEMVKLERFAPFGDPIVIRIAGYSLCLRRSEAKHIVVKVSLPISGGNKR